jgi:hypothetical protein
MHVISLFFYYDFHFYNLCRVIIGLGKGINRLTKFVSKTSTLMIETEEIPETFVFNSTLTRLIAGEDFSTFIRGESFKSYITKFYIIITNSKLVRSTLFRLMNIILNKSSVCKRKHENYKSIEA